MGSLFFLSTLFCTVFSLAFWLDGQAKPFQPGMRDGEQLYFRPGKYFNLMQLDSAKIFVRGRSASHTLPDHACACGWGCRDPHVLSPAGFRSHWRGLQRQGETRSDNGLKTILEEGEEEEREEEEEEDTSASSSSSSGSSASDTSDADSSSSSSESSSGSSDSNSRE